MSLLRCPPPLAAPRSTPAPLSLRAYMWGTAVRAYHTQTRGWTLQERAGVRREDLCRDSRGRRGAGSTVNAGRRLWGGLSNGIGLATQQPGILQSVPLTPRSTPCRECPCIYLPRVQTWGGGARDRSLWTGKPRELWGERHKSRRGSKMPQQRASLMERCKEVSTKLLSSPAACSPCGPWRHVKQQSCAA